MKNANQQKLLLAAASAAFLLLVGLLWTGCAASRSYPGPVHGLTFDGTVQSIDRQNHRLTLAPLKPSELAVFVWETITKFWQNEIPIRPESVEPGRTVRVHYHETAGQLVAHHVYVQAPYAPVH